MSFFKLNLTVIDPIVILCPNIGWSVIAYSFQFPLWASFSKFQNGIFQNTCFHWGKGACKILVQNEYTSNTHWVSITCKDNVILSSWLSKKQNGFSMAGLGQDKGQENGCGIVYGNHGGLWWFFWI